VEPGVGEESSLLRDWIAATVMSGCSNAVPAGDGELDADPVLQPAAPVSTVIVSTAVMATKRPPGRTPAGTGPLDLPDGDEPMTCPWFMCNRGPPLPQFSPPSHPKFNELDQIITF